MVKWNAFQLPFLRTLYCWAVRFQKPGSHHSLRSFNASLHVILCMTKACPRIRFRWFVKKTKSVETLSPNLGDTTHPWLDFGHTHDRWKGTLSNFGIQMWVDTPMWWWRMIDDVLDPGKSSLRSHPTSKQWCWWKYGSQVIFRRKCFPFPVISSSLLW